MSKFLIDGDGKSYMQASTTAIYPSNTELAFGKIGTTWLKGIPDDFCWLFKSDEGTINTYSFIPEQGTNLIIAI